MDRSLGRLAIAAGSIELALEHIAAARAQSERAGALPVGDARDARRGPRAAGPRARPRTTTASAELARQVLERAQQIGMGLVVDAAVALEVELGFGVEAEA